MKRAPWCSRVILIGSVLAGSVLAGAVLAAGAADAPGDPVTPDRARTLATQLRAALTDTLAGWILPAIAVSAAGDHYDIALDFAGQTATATGRQAQGIWRIDAITLPSPGTWHLAAPGQAPVRVAVKIAEQEASAVFDPSSTTASSLLAKYRAVRMEAVAPLHRSLSHFDTATVALAAVPAAAGRSDVTETLAFTGYSGESHAAGGPDGYGFVNQASLRAHFAAISLPEAAAAGQAWRRLMASVSAAPPTLDMGAAHRLVLSLRDVLAGLDVTETAQGVQFDRGGQGFHIDHASLGLSAAAPADMLDARLEVKLEGLTVPSVSRADGGDLIPRNLSARPEVSGIDMRDATRLALAATEAKASWPDLLVQVLALLSHGAIQGGIEIGIDDFAADIGPAHVAGTLHASIAGLVRNHGEGRITATGFDALIARLRELPAAAAALPTVQALRDLARSEDDALVWDLRLQDGRLLVNGADPTRVAQARKL